MARPNLEDVAGVGTTLAAALRGLGITSVARLAAVSTDELAGIQRLGRLRGAALIGEARKLLGLSVDTIATPSATTIAAPRKSPRPSRGAAAKPQAPLAPPASPAVENASSEPDSGAKKSAPKGKARTPVKRQAASKTEGDEKSEKKDKKSKKGKKGKKKANAKKKGEKDKPKKKSKAGKKPSKKKAGKSSKKDKKKSKN